MPNDRYNREVKVGDHIIWTWSKTNTYAGKIVGFSKTGLPLVLSYNYEMNEWSKSTWVVRTKLFVKIKAII